MLELIIKEKNSRKKIFLNKSKIQTQKKNKKNKKNRKNNQSIKNNLSLPRGGFKKVREIIVEKKMSDDKVSKLEGKYLSDKYFDTIIKNDTDIFYFNDNKKILLAKFRKNVLPKKECRKVIDNLKEAAKKEHDNRGAAAGRLDFNKLPDYIDKNKVKKQSRYVIRGYYSKKKGGYVEQIIGNKAKSNIIGYYDKPDRNLGQGAPLCRLTSFNEKNLEKFNNVIPFIESVDNQFKKLVPIEYKKQHKRAHQTKFVIKDTAFSTLTINHNWRTALHKDTGDFKDGFGNLVVCEEGKYSGGYTGFPQFGVAFDVREGDFLAMDVHEWHCNTKIKGKRKKNKDGKMEDDFSRLSLVCYLRDKMIRCRGMKI